MMTIEERLARDAARAHRQEVPDLADLLNRALERDVRRRRRVGWSVMVAAAVVVLIAASTVLIRTQRSSPSPPGGQRTVSAPPAQSWTSIRLSGHGTVQIPATWHVTKYRGIPAPVYFPILFISTAPFYGPCRSGAVNSLCTTRNWFAPGWQAPGAGALVRWGLIEILGPRDSALTPVPGRRTTIDGKPAKVRAGAATSSCPAGTGSEIDAQVLAYSQSSERLHMVACLGPHASQSVRKAIYTMLRSLRIPPS